jgi:hypothetical protein
LYIVTTVVYKKTANEKRSMVIRSVIFGISMAHATESKIFLTSNFFQGLGHLSAAAADSSLLLELPANTKFQPSITPTPEPDDKVAKKSSKSKKRKAEALLAAAAASNASSNATTHLGININGFGLQMTTSTGKSLIVERFIRLLQRAPVFGDDALENSDFEGKFSLVYIFYSCFTFES